MNKQTKPKTWVILNDIQIPYQDRKVLELVLNFIDDLAPDGVILNGDINDLYNLSEFDKDPEKDAHLGIEISESAELMERLQFIPEKIWHGGNHEDRLRRKIWKRTPGLAVRELDFPNLFHLSDFGFSWKPYGGYTMLGNLIVTHGNVVTAHSAYSAKKNFDKRGTSVITGHTHRLGTYYKTNRYGTHISIENGCLCRMDLEYVVEPDWQHGFSVVHVWPNKMFNVQQIAILNRKTFMYGAEMRAA